MRHIHVAGFGGVIKCGYKMVDNHLVTALVERWRPETHTFHFKFGETTITLEDVQVLWGLPIRDEVVSGRDTRLTFPEQRYLCNELLGLHVEENEFKNQILRLTRLIAELGNDFPDDASEDDCDRRARVYILHLLGGTLFPDSSSSSVFFHYLSHRDFDECGRLSWASAVLAYLFKNLCKGASSKAIEIYGPTMLLHLWAWERISLVSPTRSMEYQSGKAYGSRWNCHLSFREIPNHALSHYRS
ncbi:serine/threonine-protein phosphatase 7 long form homolog [Bidens hawaiensis]|uniref:serine/threonine-protein phosphatase 7 long form homolog n=1 Tax=Bidens hawaiensis TaxID=980011 RepID=UPI00404BA45A